ncbi:MAG: Two component regulator three Y domain protein, partial [Flavobacterium sp.]|nr:Two component regulator three Y domain protein [Flavobacterium sp.]
FENELQGQVPFDLERLENLRELNISYNRFGGAVSKRLAEKDVLKMTMVNQYGMAAMLPIEIKNNTAIAVEE